MLTTLVDTPVNLSLLISRFVLCEYTYNYKATKKKLNSVKFDHPKYARRSRYLTLISWLEELKAGAKFELESGFTTDEWIRIYNLLIG